MYDRYSEAQMHFNFLSWTKKESVMIDTYFHFNYNINAYLNSVYLETEAWIDTVSFYKKKSADDTLANYIFRAPEALIKKKHKSGKY